MKIKMIIAAAVVLMSFTADKPAYQLYNQEGKKVKYEKMIKALNKADVIFIGELHNNPISHWAEYEITKDLYQKHEAGIILGAEMFESDNQLVINEYLKGYFPDKKFEADARLWPNYNTDYKPLMTFAKKNKLNFVASNIPRRYASIVFKEGFEGLNKLTDEGKRYIAPLPPKYDPNVKCYADMIEMGKKMGHGTAEFPKAQAIKDATMAYFIQKNLEKGKLFIHYNGSYHSDNHEGIVWYLKNANPKLKILTVSCVEQKNIKELKEDNKNLADYIFAIPETMTKTY
ncbi:MAG: iron-regulated protein [Bacteroidetes bacterium]|nr:MAG: iron-regulated protein [Bacteroidota bacterium]